MFAGVTPDDEPVGPGRLPWLEALAGACERVLARRNEADPTDAASAMLFTTSPLF